MVDWFDRAQELEQRQRDQAIKAQLLSHCQDCDKEIPPARQALGGKTRCVPCQMGFEQSNRR